MGFSLDISNHKKGLNIQQLKDEGLYHLYLKATEGMGYVDPCLEDFYNQAVNAGVPLGYYHFATANPNIEGQAEDFYNAVKGKKADLLYSLDMERDMPTGVSYSDFARRFINKFESLMGKTNICNIYASAYYARDNFDQDIKDRIPLWVAQYGTGAGNYIGTGFKNICGHQYSKNESHGGQPCDSNIFYPSIMLDSAIEGNSDPIDNSTTQQPIGGKISELQDLCNRILGTDLSVDNIWGPQTDNAVRNLPLAGLPYRTPELTTWIQLRLGCSVDGIFGNETYKAVCKWQREHGLKEDGIAGYYTIKSLATNNR